MASRIAAAYLSTMKPTLPLVTGALLLVACTPVAFQKPGVTVEQAQADSDECRVLADREAMRAPRWPWASFPRSHAYGPHAFDPFWPRKFSSLSFERMRAERDLADFCMRARGYELRPVPDPTAS